MATNATSSEVECTCPVCCDIFKDPVLLLCGHSFCKYCLQEWWRQSRIKTCPVCKEIFPIAQPPRNLALKNLSDTLREGRNRRDTSGSKEVCSLHSEKLKLFCQDDQQLICVICRDSQKHKKHNCFPVNEAAEAHRTQVKVQMMQLKSKLGSYKKEKLTCDKMAKHINLQAQQTERAIREEFQKLYQFLRAEEAARIDEVRKEARHKTEAMNIRIDNLTAEISSLSENIKTAEREMKAEDISFMLNVKSTMKRSQCNLPEPETPSGALIDEAKHLGNLLFTVWNEMKNIIQYTPVTLDPNTSDMIISEQMTRSTKRDNFQPLPDNPERLRSEVLGSNGFSSGKHSWDVELEDLWAVGVATRAKNLVTEKIWSIYVYSNHHFLRERTPEDDVEIVSGNIFPQKVTVQLDYDQGILSFVDIERKRLVHTIRYTFTEMVYPYFSANAKILPAELSVWSRQPR